VRFTLAHPSSVKNFFCTDHCKNTFAIGRYPRYSLLEMVCFKIRVFYFYAMVLDFIRCTRNHLPLLSKVARHTFSHAFESQNEAEDFQNYLNHAFTVQQMAKEMATVGTVFFLVYRNDTLCGYFKVNSNAAQTDIKRADSMELERIYVMASVQGQGIGTKIIAHVMGMAQADKKRFLWLGVWERNKEAIKLYQRLGFRKFGTHPYYIGNDKQTDWLMRKEIHTLEA